MKYNFAVFIVMFALQLSLPASATEVDWANMTIIDVRTETEWKESHLEGALWIPWASIEKGAEEHKLDKDLPLGFYCAAGVRAERAIRRLNKLGYSQTYNLINVNTAAELSKRKIIR